MLAETEDHTYKVHPNLRNKIDEEKIKEFKLVGLILGKAVLERIPISAYLDRTILQLILGNQVSVEDIQHYDDGLYN